MLQFDKNSWLKKKYTSFKSQFSDLRTWARKEKKFTTLRTSYTFLRYIFLSYPIRLRNHHKLVIIGCGRSATKFVSKLFHDLDIQIGHERIEKHGIASWTLVPDTDIKIWGPSYNQIRHLNMPIVHQVRSPLEVISSAMTVFSDQRTWNFIREFIPINESDSLILQSMKYWYFWNLLAEKKAVYTFRIEEIENEIEVLLKIGRFRTTANRKAVMNSISKKINSRQHDSLSWDDLKKTDEALAHKILDLSCKYGYDL